MTDRSDYALSSCPDLSNPHPGPIPDELGTCPCHFRLTGRMTDRRICTEHRAYWPAEKAKEYPHRPRSIESKLLYGCKSVCEILDPTFEKHWNITKSSIGLNTRGYLLHCQRKQMPATLVGLARWLLDSMWFTGTITLRPRKSEEDDCVDCVHVPMDEDDRPMELGGKVCCVAGNRQALADLVDRYIHKVMLTDGVAQGWLQIDGASRRNPTQ